MANKQVLSTEVRIGAALDGSYNSTVGSALKKMNVVGNALEKTSKKLDLANSVNIKGIRELRAKYLDAKRSLSGLETELKESESASRQSTAAYRKQKTAVDKLAHELSQAKNPSQALVYQFEREREKLKQLEKEKKDHAKTTKSLTSRVTAQKKEVAKLNDVVKKEIATQKKSRDALREAGVDTRKLSAYTETLTKKFKSLNRVKSRGLQVGAAYGEMTSSVGSALRTTSLIAGAAGAALFGVTNSTAKLGDSVAKTADKIGISGDKLQELRYAGERSGVSIEKVDSSLERFQKRIGEAVQGTGAAKKAYEGLGLSVQALAAMTPDEAFYAVADRLDSIDSQSEKIAYAAAIFGREGVGMVNMIRGGREALNQLGKEAHATGYQLSDKDLRAAEKYTDQMYDFTLAATGLKNVFGTKLMPILGGALTQTKNQFLSTREEVDELADSLAHGVEQSIPFVKTLGSALLAAGGIISNTVSVMSNLVGGTDNLGMILGAVFAVKAVWAIGMFGKALWGLALSNPIGILVTGLTVGAAMIYSNWEKISGFFSGVGDDLVKLGGLGKSVLSEIWGGITGVVGKIWNELLRLGDIGKSILGKVFSWSPIGLLYNNWGGVSKWFSQMWDGVTAKAGSALEWIMNKLSWVGDAFRKVTNFLGFGDDEDEAPKRQNVIQMSEYRTRKNMQIVGQAMYRIQQPEKGKLADVHALASYRTVPPEQANLKDISAQAHYQTGIGAPPNAQPLRSVVTYEPVMKPAEAPRLGSSIEYTNSEINAPYVPEIGSTLRYATEDPDAPNLPDIQADQLGTPQQRLEAAMKRLQSQQSVTHNNKQETHTTNHTDNSSVVVHVTQQPGQSVEELVDEIERRQREERERLLFDDGADDYRYGA